MRSIVLLGVFAFVWGCVDGDGFDGTPVSSNESSEDSFNSGIGIDPRASVDNSGVEIEGDLTVRVASLKFTSAPASDLNSIIALNLEQSLEKPILILYQFQGLGEAEEDPALLVVSGDKASSPGEFRVDPVAPVQSVPVTYDGDSGEFSAQFDTYRFIANITFNNDQQSVDIPVTDFSLSGALNVAEDGGSATIAEGRWEGHVTREDGDTTMVRLSGSSSPRPLTDLFREDTLNYDTASESEVTPGTGDAWSVSAVFDAVEAELLQESL